MTILVTNFTVLKAH